MFNESCVANHKMRGFCIFSKLQFKNIFCLFVVLSKGKLLLPSKFRKMRLRLKHCRQRIDVYHLIFNLFLVEDTEVLSLAWMQIWSGGQRSWHNWDRWHWHYCHHWSHHHWQGLPVLIHSDQDHHWHSGSQSIESSDCNIFTTPEPITSWLNCFC